MVFADCVCAISIRAPREGSDDGRDLADHGLGFLSALPARGATMPLPSRWTMQLISIRAPREGSDKSHMMEQMEQMIFLSALPARGATVAVQPSWIVYKHFYPRSPRGERPRRHDRHAAHRNFYPRSPRGERHDAVGTSHRGFAISIRAPREGSDLGRQLHRRRN